MDSIESTVVRFIAENFYVEHALDRDASLLDRGIVDSTGVLELTAFLEAELGIRVTDDEIVPENLDSVAAIVAFVERKKKQSAKAA